jgi:undecaprenyl diphosphate synthase
MNIPKHIAIIMDGNGRWAKARHLPRITGHKKGVDAVRKVVKRCEEIGVKTLTLFAFSSENKNRSNEEVSLLFSLFLTALERETQKLNAHNIRLKIIGDLSLFPVKIQKKAQQAQQDLAKNTGLELVIAANYGGQWDILNACQNILKAGLDPNTLNQEEFVRYLALEGKSVDLFIRSSGELRLSNFLLWDLAYSELYFTDTLWPDFNASTLDKSIENFNRRNRRYGARNE